MRAERDSATSIKMSESSTPPLIQTEISSLLPASDVIYFNGFGLALSAGDVVVTLTRNGIPIVTLNSSFTVSKSFSRALAATVHQLEELMGKEIMTVEEIAKKMAKRTENKQ